MPATTRRGTATENEPGCLGIATPRDPRFCPQGRQARLHHERQATDPAVERRLAWTGCAGGHARDSARARDDPATAACPPPNPTNNPRHPSRDAPRRVCYAPVTGTSGGSEARG
ncbi:MAG: hypothetical protein AMXMBFR64_23890 [Myxococcales bacterium]